MNEEKLLEVGDRIEVDNRLFKKWISTIVRVTKTQAVGNIPGNKSATLKFRRKYYDSDIYPVGKEPWRTVTYKLLPKNDNNG